VKSSAKESQAIFGPKEAREGEAWEKKSGKRDTLEEETGASVRT